jgi:hypothetical protein
VKQAPDRNGKIGNRPGYDRLRTAKREVAIVLL